MRSQIHNFMQYFSAFSFPLIYQPNLIGNWDRSANLFKIDLEVIYF